MYIGDKLMIKATEKFHTIFKEYWFKWLTELYIHKYTIGFAPWKIVYKEELDILVPEIVPLQYGYLVHIWYKDEEYGKQIN